MTKKSTKPWFKFFPSDWLQGVRKLKPAEIGIYINLIANMYEEGGPLPLNLTRLSVMCGCSPRQMKAALERLEEMGKVKNVDGFVLQNRVQKELQKRASLSDTKRAAAKTRWGEKPNENNDGDDADAPPSDNAYADADAFFSYTRARVSSDNSDINHRSTVSTTELNLQTERPTQPEGGDEKISPPPPPAELDLSKYAWQGYRVRLTHDDYGRWQKAFKHLDLDAELQNRDDWYRGGGGKEKNHNWFQATSNWLANRNRKAKSETEAAGKPRRSGHEDFMAQFG